MAGTLVVDPTHWMPDYDELPEDPRLRRELLRVVRFVEYAVDLPPGHFRDTSVECRRPRAGCPAPG
jgi:hypothetical protein